MEEKVMKLTFLRHTDKNGSSFHIVKGQDDYANFKIAEHYYRGILKTLTEDSKLLNKFLDLLNSTDAFDDIEINEVHDNRRIKSSFKGFGNLKGEMIEPKIIGGDLQFKIKEESLDKLEALAKDNEGNPVPPKDDPTFAIRLDYVAASMLKTRRKHMKLYYHEEDPNKVVVSLPLFDGTIYVSNTFNNPYMSPKARFAQIGFNLNKSYIKSDNHLDEYMKINHIADMGGIDISKEFKDADQYLSMDMKIDDNSPINDYVVLTYVSRPNDLSVLLPSDTIFAIDREEKNKLEYFILNMGRYEYLHLCDTKGRTIKNDEGKDIMIHAVDVLDDLYLEHDNRHAFLSRGAGASEEYDKAPFGYADVIDFVYANSGMSAISTIMNDIYLIPEHMVSNMNKANNIYGEYVSLSEIFKAGKEPISLEDAKNIDKCTNAEYNKIIYSLVAEAIIRNAQYNDDPTFPFRTGTPSFRLYEINNKYTGDKFNNLILAYGPGGTLWTGKKDREMIADNIATHSKPLFINFPFRVGSLDDAKRYVVSNRRKDTKNVDLSFLDGEKEYRRSPFKHSPIPEQNKWKYDDFDQEPVPAEPCNCLTIYENVENYDKKVDLLYNTLDSIRRLGGAPTERYHVVFTDEEHGSKGVSEYATKLVEAKQPWSCAIKNLNKFELYQLAAAATKDHEVAEVASLMNKAFGYDEFKLEPEICDDYLYLYGCRDKGEELMAVVCDDYQYEKIKSQVYDNWLMKPFKSNK